LIKGIIFDLYDTLIHLDPKHYDFMKRKFSKMVGAPHDRVRTIWRKYINRRMTGEIPTIADMIRILLDELNIDHDEKKLDELVEMETRTLIESVRFYPGVDRMLENFRNQGYQLTLLSNTSHNSMNIIKMLPWKSNFHHVILSHKIGIIKPDPRIYLIALARMELKPEECIFVGDGGSMELDGARLVGLTTVKVVQENQNQSFKRSGNPDYQIDTIIKLTELLDKLNKT